MTAGLYEVSRPLAFFTAKAPGLGLFRDVVPLATAIACVLLYVFVLPVPIALVGHDSISSIMAPLFASLPGFFIAALAAVATFQGGDLDRTMPDATIWFKIRGEGKREGVTLRVFLSYLFAFLTVAAFAGFLLCGLASILAPNLREVSVLAGKTKSPIDGGLVWLARPLFVLATAYLMTLVVSCTALGLYFLAERVHQELG